MYELAYCRQSMTVIVFLGSVNEPSRLMYHISTVYRTQYNEANIL